MTINLNNIKSVYARRAIITVTVVPLVVYGALQGAYHGSRCVLISASQHWKHRVTRPS